MSRLDELEIALEKLAGLLDEADTRTAPGIVRELRAVLLEIESIPGAGKSSSTRDDLKSKRAARQAEAADRARTAGS